MSVSESAAEVSSRPTPTLTEILLVFAKVSLSGFGGVLAWARRELVERKKWLTPAEFNDLFALSQFLPGPNIVNLSVVYGSRLRGPMGAVMASIGLLGPPLVIVTTLAMLYSHFSDSDALRRILAGISAAAAGLLIATLAKMTISSLNEHVIPAVIMLVAAFVAIGILRLPLPHVLVTLVPISNAIAWWVRR